MTTRNPDPHTYEAIESFTTTIGKRAYSVTAGDRAGGEHELVKTHPALFRPMTVQFPADEVAVKGQRS